MDEIQTLELAGHQVIVLPRGRKVETIQLCGDDVVTMFLELPDTVAARLTLLAAEAGIDVGEYIAESLMDVLEEEDEDDDEDTQVDAHRILEPLDW